MHTASSVGMLMSNEQRRLEEKLICQNKQHMIIVIFSAKNRVTKQLTKQQMFFPPVTAPQITQT